MANDDWLAYLAMGLGTAMQGYSRQRNIRLERERRERIEDESNERFEKQWQQRLKEREEDVGYRSQRDRETTLWRMRSEGLSKDRLEEAKRANRAREKQAGKRYDLSSAVAQASHALAASREQRLSEQDRTRSPFADVPIGDRKALEYRLSQLTPESAAQLQKQIAEGKAPDINDPSFMNEYGFFDEAKYRAATQQFKSGRGMDEALMALWQNKQAAEQQAAQQMTEQPNPVTGEPAASPTRMPPTPEEQAMQAGEQNAQAIQAAQHGLPGLTERDQVEAGEVMRMVPIMLNPNLPVPMQLQAWIRFQELTGVEPPEEVKAILNAQGGPMGGMSPQALPPGQPGIDPSMLGGVAGAAGGQLPPHLRR